MAVTATPIFPQAIASATYTVTTSAATAFTAGANGAKVDVLSASNQGATSDLTIYIGGTTAILTVLSISTNSGFTNAVPAVDILRSSQIPGLTVDAFGNKCLYLAPSQTISMKSSSSTTIIVFAQIANF